MAASPPVRAAEPGFVAHFPKDYQNLVAVNDPLPHLQRLLTSPALRRVLTEGKLGRALRRDGAIQRTDPALLWDTVNQNRNWVPSEVAIGLPDSAIADLDHAARAGLLASLAAATRSAGQDSIKNDLPKIQDQLLPELRLG